jgi:asparagine synthetase B (glutamine-hydrolysing)
MCGIFGIWNLDGRSIDLAALRLANDSIRHQGPVDEDYLLVNTRTAEARFCAGPDTITG